MLPNCNRPTSTMVRHWLSVLMVMLLQVAADPASAQSASREPPAGITRGDDIDFLRELVSIGSDTSETENVDACQRLVAKRLEQLGFLVQYTPQRSTKVKTGSLLVAERPGIRPRFVTLLLHMDTVFPASSGFSGFRRDGNRAVGPGVVDAKGGVVVALRAISEVVASAQKTGYSLRVVVSPAEEIGSTGFLDQFETMSLDTDYLFGFEPALSNGSIVSSRRGDRWYDIHVEGIEAHAGRDHKKGANACHELAIKIDRLQRLTDYRKDVSVNIGHIEGGKDKYAIVCGRAHAKLDVRFSDPKHRAMVLRKVEKILNTAFVRSHDGSIPTRTTYEIVDDPHPFSVQRVAIPVIRQLLESIETYERRTVNHERSGGTSDANFFYREGIVIVDGLGPVGGNMHRNDEYIDLTTIGTRARAVAQVIKSLQ